MFSGCRLLMWSISVSLFSFFIKIRPLVFPFEWFYTGHSLGPFIAFCSVWAKAPCWRPYIDLSWFTFINWYLEGELSHLHSHHIFLYLYKTFYLEIVIKCVLNHLIRKCIENYLAGSSWRCYKLHGTHDVCYILMHNKNEFLVSINK